MEGILALSGIIVVCWVLYETVINTASRPSWFGTLPSVIDLWGEKDA